MSTQTETFTAAGYGAAFTLQPGQSLTYASVGNALGQAYVTLQRSRTQGAAWIPLAVSALAGDISGTAKNETNAEERYRFAVSDESAIAAVTGDTACTIADAVDRTGLLKDDKGNRVGYSHDAGVNFDADVNSAGAINAGTTLSTQGAATFGGVVTLVGGVQVLTGDGVPVDYTDGTPPATGEGVAEKGSLYSDYTNGKLYINGGTLAQPVWKLVTSAA